MKILLKKNITKLGFLGDLVEVRMGYARNYLIPQGYAVQVSVSNKKQIEHQLSILAKKRAESIEMNKSLAEKINAIQLEFRVKAGKTGRLFGSVTSKQVEEALKDKGIELDRKLLVMSGGIKQIGTISVPVRLHSEVESSLTIKLISDSTDLIVESQENKPTEEKEKVEDKDSTDN